MTERRGKVVVNRAVSIDGFIFGPQYSRFWVGGRKIGDVVPWEDQVEAASRTGAMLVGRNTSDVGDLMAAEETDAVNYPWDGALFLLTHRPPKDVEGFTVLSGDIRAAVETALAAANGKDLELLGADVASQAFAAGLVDEVLVYVLPVILGEGVPFSPPGSAMVNLEPIESRQSGEVTILRFRVKK